MIIAIGGPSNAGKTHLTQRLCAYFGKTKAAGLCQDDFVKPLEQIPQIRQHLDWEHPDSIHHQRLRNSIIELSHEKEIVLVEGLMIYHDRETLGLFDKKLFVDIDFATFWKRRSADTRWGIEPDWYLEHIWKSYLMYGKAPEIPDLMMINGSKPIRLKSIIEYLEK